MRSRKEGSILCVGVDISLANTGIAMLYDRDKEPTGKLVMVKTKPGQHSTSVERVHWVGKSVLKAISSYSQSVSVPREQVWIGVEGYAMNIRVGKALDRAEVTGFVKQLLFSWCGRPPLLVPPTTLKKFICGRGNVDKTHHLSYALEKWKIHFPNDDLCDAFAVAKLIRCLLAEQQESLFKYEQECVKTVQVHGDNPTILQHFCN